MTLQQTSTSLFVAVIASTFLTIILGDYIIRSVDTFCANLARLTTLLNITANHFPVLSVFPSRYPLPLLFRMALSISLSIFLTFLRIRMAPFLCSGSIAKFAKIVKFSFVTSAYVKIFDSGRKPIQADIALLIGNRLVDHLKFSFAGFASEAVDGAAKLAVRAGYKAALVHKQIISHGVL